MTPKEKAIEICMQFASLTNDSFITNHSKLSALIAVELRLDGHFSFTSLDYGEDSFEFWETVKHEIDTL